jgi:hypothetical protein
MFFMSAMKYQDQKYPNLITVPHKIENPGLERFGSRTKSGRGRGVGITI